VIDMVGQVRIVTCPCGCNIAFTTTNKRKRYLNEAHKARAARDRSFEENWRARLPQDVFSCWALYLSRIDIAIEQRQSSKRIIEDLVHDHNLYVIARAIQAICITCEIPRVIDLAMELNDTIADMRVGRRVKSDSKVIQLQQLRNMAK